jgi:hypothetical protein
MKQLADAINRRFFFRSSASLTVPLVQAHRKGEDIYHFATDDWSIRMTTEFYDRYSGKGFWIDDRHPARQHCLSGTTDQDQDCLSGFSGSVAVVRYHFRARASKGRLTTLREHVRTIDQDERLADRAPFDRTITFDDGVASDIQAFGYGDGKGLAPESSERNPPWCLLRQDLYCDGQAFPFLVVHWRHSPSAIRIVDIVPGKQTTALT